MSTAETVADAGQPLVLAQRADLKSFLGLSLKNGLLNLVTLTLYRFWGKTEVRRRVWSTTYLNDEPFEYTGRGIELFLGFLIVLVVVALPFLLIVFGAQFLGPGPAAAILLPLYAILLLLVGFGRFTAFRYLASRTSWRGVRFLLHGEAWKYASKFLGYVLLSVVTLGWFWPAAARRLAAPLWGGLRFGDRSFHFDLDAARREKLYSAYAIGWVGMIVAYLLMLAGMFTYAMGRVSPDGAPHDLTLAEIIVSYAFYGVLALAYVVVFAPYRAAVLRSVTAGIGMEGARFRMNVKWTEVARLSLGNVALVTLSLGFLMPFVQARVAKFLIQRLDAEGGVAFATIRQAADVGPRTGEGLADAFDLSPI
jgi:uncharacterized membrane protein YjgN (DUF898 family)